MMSYFKEALVVILFTSLLLWVLSNQYNGLPSVLPFPGLGMVLASSNHGFMVGHTAKFLYSVFTSVPKVPICEEVEKVLPVLTSKLGLIL